MITEQDGTIWIETRRKGLLSAVGHDLRLEVGRFEVTVSADRTAVSARAQAGSVGLRAALDGQHELPTSIGRRDKARIERKVTDEVLHARHHPAISFESTSVVATPNGYLVEGSLSIRGVARRVSAAAIRRDARLEARFAIRTSDFGIRPVTALMGALKVRDEVHIVVNLPD